MIGEEIGTRYSTWLDLPEPTQNAVYALGTETIGRRYFSAGSMAKLLEPSNEEVVKTLLELQSA